MDYLRRLLRSTAGRIIAVVLAMVFMSTAVYAVISFLKGNNPEAAYSTMYMCTETGKPFRHTNKIGETQPIHSPFSGKNTGVPAEACYWTADGQTKKEPTWVLLNELAGKAGPTFCPDCGRLVVGHNPPPGPGVKPPPTREQYLSRNQPRLGAAPARDDRR